MRPRTPLLALLAAAACGGAGVQDRVSVLGVDRLSGELGAQEVELPGTDLAAVRGPAGILMLGTSSESRAPDCALRRKVSGALVARTLPCVSMLGQYAAMDRARQFLLSAGAEALAPAVVLVEASSPAGLRYVPAADS